MMKRLLFIAVMLWSVAYGQSTGYLRYDTVRIQKVGGNATLIVENSTRNVTGGVLTNVGGGRTQFLAPSAPDNTIDVFPIVGQSNAVGNSGSPSSAIVPLTGTAFQYYNNTLSAAVEPIGNSNGSAWGAYAVTYYKLTGRKICFVPVAVNGSSMTHAANIQGFGTWDTTGTLYDTSIARINRALVALAAAGYTPAFKGILFCQGETDADGINRGLISSATYTAALAKLIKNYRLQYGKHISFNIFRIGYRTDTIQGGYTQIQAAQVAIANPDSLINVVFWNASDFPTRALMQDVYHYTQAGYNEMGRTGSENYINSSANNWQTQSGNVYFKKGNVGIGIGIPTSPIHISNTGVANQINIAGNVTNDASRIEIENTSNTSLAGAGIRLKNNLGLRSQIILLSQASSLESDALWIFNSGNVLMGSTSGIVNFYNDGSASPLNAKLRIYTGGNIGIGNNVTPHASAQLDIVSTTRGLRIPTMTGAQMTAISSPATGLLVWCTDSAWLCQYNGSAWQKVSGTGGGGGGSGTVNSGTQYRLAYYATTGTAVSEAAAITADRALISDANGVPTHSTTTATEMGYLSGVTSALQTQLNDKWSLSGNSVTAGTQFLGSTNNVSVKYITNNTFRGSIDSTGLWRHFGRMNINTPADDANHGVVIEAPDNTTNHGLKVISNNGTADIEIGYGQIDFSIGGMINAGSATLNLNTSAGVTLGPTGSAATAWSDLAAGTTSKAPQRYNTGSLLTTIAVGRSEYGTSLYQTNEALNRFGVPGVINTASALVSNSGTSPTTLATYTTKANTLSATEEMIYGEIDGSFNDATGTETIGITFAGTSIFSQAGIAGNPRGWHIRYKVVRTGASTATAVVNYQSSTEIYNTTTMLTGLTFSGTNAFVVTGTSSQATTDAIRKESFRMNWCPAANN